MRHAELALVGNELRRGGTRVTLAVAAVAVGIAAMTLLRALEAGARRELENATDVGVLTITAGRVDAPPGRGVGSFASTALDLDDVAALRTDLGGARRVVPIAERALRIRLGDRAAVTSVRGVTPDYFLLRNLEIARGRLTDDLDAFTLARVAVVGSFVTGKLGRPVVGATISIAGVPFEVIGELGRKGVAGDGTNEDDQILVPLQTAERRLFNARFLSAALVELAARAERDRVEASARALLRRSHRLDAAARDDFQILAAIRADENLRGQTELVRRLMQPFAFVTIVIGGIAVLVVTYLNVLDRTAEIGLRMAIGARRRDIARLFVLEAACVSLLGGMFGGVAAWLGVGAARVILGWPLAIDGGAFVLPFGVALLLGVVCSAGPAVRAAHLMPVDSLTYD